MSGGTTTKHTAESLLRRLSKAGFSREFVRAAVLPDWWDESSASKRSLLPDLEIRVARFLVVPLNSVQEAGKKLAPPEYPKAQLRKVRNIDQDRLGPSIHTGLSVAAAFTRTQRPVTGLLATFALQSVAFAIQFRGMIPVPGVALTVIVLFYAGALTAPYIAICRRALGVPLTNAEQCSSL